MLPRFSFLPPSSRRSFAIPWKHCLFFQSLSPLRVLLLRQLLVLPCVCGYLSLPGLIRLIHAIRRNSDPACPRHTSNSLRLLPLRLSSFLLVDRPLRAVVLCEANRLDTARCKSTEIDCDGGYSEDQADCLRDCGHVSSFGLWYQCTTFLPRALYTFSFMILTLWTVCVFSMGTSIQSAHEDHFHRNQLHRKLLRFLPRTNARTSNGYSHYIGRSWKPGHVCVGNPPGIVDRRKGPSLDDVHRCDSPRHRVLPHILRFVWSLGARGGRSQFADIKLNNVAYERGQGSLGVGLLSFFAFLTGFGSSSAFSASIKTG